MKKIISLGGNFFQKTLVQAAKRMGVYVIDVDYLPDNPAHKYADEYYNISTLDREAVLKLAIEKGVDGIVSYASDISAPTAAYVSEKLNLPGNPLDTINIMTDKSLFHPFLKKHGFYVPDNEIVADYEQLVTFYEKSRDRIIVKPSHGSGSRGVSVVKDMDGLYDAWEEALKYADKSVIVEEFIPRVGHQIAGDAFVRNGEIVFLGCANEHFDNDCNLLVPVGESFPAHISNDCKETAKYVIGAALHSLGFVIGAVNLDFHFTSKGNVFLIELGPRNGGNLITDAIKISSGLDLAEYTVKAAIGEDISDLSDKTMERFIGTYIWHSAQEGIYQYIRYDRVLEEKLIRSDLFIQPGDKVWKYVNGKFGIGAALIEFQSMDEMIYMMDHMTDYYEIVLA